MVQSTRGLYMAAEILISSLDLAQLGGSEANKMTGRNFGLESVVGT